KKEQMVVRLRQMAVQKGPLGGRRPSTLARRPSRGFRWGQTVVHPCQTAIHG
ncbi:unnamed protein product, partial [Sphenostylis stenocarpa]